VAATDFNKHFVRALSNTFGLMAGELVREDKVVDGTIPDSGRSL
jgi:hypothetical protein